MKESIKILVWAFFVILAFIFQVNHFFALKGINPNLILLVIILAAVLEKKIFGFLSLISMVILLSFVFLPFWPKEIFIAAGLGLAFFLLKKFLTGSVFFDSLILIFSGTLIFYLIVNFHYLVSSPIAVIAELPYNMTLGIAAIFAIKNFLHEKENRIKS
ncbi:MAG: hypothetical protein WC475_00810 [Candidatus Paceibacterota bacterium]